MFIVEVGSLLTSLVFIQELLAGTGSPLFTGQVFDQAIPEAERGMLLLSQAGEQSRTQLLDQFKSNPRSVLFGTDSFWTGIDIPGPALSQVLITRLPFDVPTHPVAEARAEWVRARGGNPFAEITLPDALIKFRQGVGRLIRRWDDRGVITVLDSRILHKTYGRQFLQSLPVSRTRLIPTRTPTLVHMSVSTCRPFSTP